MDINTAAVLHHASPVSKSSPERESQTPPRIQFCKQISSSNGVLKRHFVHHAPPSPAGYKECLKNHAASIGGHALDGCGEFLSSVTATASDPTSLKCAACGCHRNFHRREPEEFPAPVIEYQPHHRHHPLPPPPTHPAGRESHSHSPPPISSSYMLLALSGGAPQNLNSSGSGDPNKNGSSRKRFRTKFRQDQKEKMFELADRIGWKLQKVNEEIVNGICRDIGVERGVFKVWMHNNKSTLAKRSAIDVSGDRNGAMKTEENNNGDHYLHHHRLFNGKSNNQSNDLTNASSLSS